jgi:hypothetical protein
MKFLFINSLSQQSNGQEIAPYANTNNKVQQIEHNETITKKLT